ncbi:MAG: hypothetical protein WA823_01285 [Candidatus Acidiferrales bacterium]
MYHFQYTVKTQARPEQAWEIYSNWHLWPRFANIYGQIIWSEGRPWEVGSRMEIEILRPVHAVVDHLIICCEPAKELGWIDRCLGITTSQWVEFTRMHNGGTKIHTWGDLTAPDAIFGVKKAKELLDVFTQTWYENYRMACDEMRQSLELAG